ncbi:hypothetical protein BH24CHL4_BH24CHL4_24630 [soil metagenome]
MTELTPPAPDGLFPELLWIHELIRRDLGKVQRLADDVRNGASADHVMIGITSLETEGPLWKLRVNCLSYCRFVHGHHSLEDAAVFPAIRRRDPSLVAVVDRLETDHLQIAALLDTISSSVRAPGEDDAPTQRDVLLSALDGLAAQLLEHLTVEEESLGAVLQEMTFADVMS